MATRRQTQDQRYTGLPNAAVAVPGDDDVIERADDPATSRGGQERGQRAAQDPVTDVEDEEAEDDADDELQDADDEADDEVDGEEEDGSGGHV
jgi:hypothetical protein